jgi:hypothetical protein
MSKVVFLADFFKEQVTGGAEINDNTLIEFLDNQNLLHAKINCYEITPEYLLANKDKYYIISNFVSLKTVCKATLYQFCKYSIYEHDYKFLKCRNPINFPEFIAPKGELTNLNFYKGAHRVICLSKLQKGIYEKNLSLKNLENIGTSLFSEELIEFLLSLSKGEKVKEYAVIESNNIIKCTDKTVQFCKQKKWDYDLISNPDNNEFLKILSEYQNLVFMTGHPEPTPRLAIECKLMGVNMIAPRNLIGIASEDWFKKRGTEFVTGLRDARQNAYKMFRRLVSEI